MARSKGMGTLLRRGQAWSLVLQRCGKPKWYTLKCSGDRKEAEFRARVLLDKLDKGETPDGAKAKVIGMPWWQVWSRFLVKSGSGRYTTNGYKTSWDFFTDSMKEQGVSDTAKLTATHIEEFIVTLRTRKWRGRLMGIDSVRRHIKGARRVLKMCGMDQVFQGVAMPEGHADKARRLCFTEDDLLAIEKGFADDSIPMLNKDEMELAHRISLNTGLRLEDVCLLRWESIDLAKKVVSVT